MTIVNSAVSTRLDVNTFWVFTEQGLSRLELKSLMLAPVGKLDRGMGLPVWQGKELYGRHGGELVKLNQPVP